MRLHLPNGASFDSENVDLLIEKANKQILKPISLDQWVFNFNRKFEHASDYIKFFLEQNKINEYFIINENHEDFYNIHYFPHNNSITLSFKLKFIKDKIICDEEQKNINKILKKLNLKNIENSGMDIYCETLLEPTDNSYRIKIEFLK